MKKYVEAIGENVHLFEFDGVRSGDVVPALFCSDIHLDSIGCKREILKKHFDEIKHANGLIFIFGDLLDVMGSYGDRRLQREDIDPQFIQHGRTYLDLVAEYTIEFLKPYAENIALISYGNHEKTINKFHDHDILRSIVWALNLDPKVNIQLGAYSGWVIFRMMKAQNTCVVTKKIHYHHGFGGNAKRSKGMLDVQIEVMKYPDADILVRGHTHQKWFDPSTARMRITSHGKLYKDKVKYIQSGSYVDGVGDGKSGWVVEKNFNPTDIGGWFVDFHYKLSHGTKAINTRVIETPVDEF
jgi:UDP-2,3-diacylglucosamine pyrophosphatase LpxH